MSYIEVAALDVSPLNVSHHLDLSEAKFHVDPFRDHQERLGLAVGDHRVGHRAKWSWSRSFPRSSPKNVGRNQRRETFVMMALNASIRGSLS